MTSEVDAFRPGRADWEGGTTTVGLAPIPTAVRSIEPETEASILERNTRGVLPAVPLTPNFLLIYPSHNSLVRVSE